MRPFDVISAATYWYDPRDAVARYKLGPVFVSLCLSLSALTLLVGRQEGHPACKKTEW